MSDPTQTEMTANLQRAIALAQLRVIMPLDIDEVDEDEEEVAKVDYEIPDITISPGTE